MTIESNVSKNTYIGNGQTIIFPFTYKIWKYDEIKVTLEDDQGITSNIIPFSVTINKNGGGEVVLYLDDENKTPIPVGYTIALTRNMPFNQEQDFLNGGRFNAEVIEDCFDMACAERQQLKEAVERTIQIPPTSGTKPEALLNEIFSARNEAVEKAAAATAGAEISTEQAKLSQSYAQSSNEQAVLSQEYANTARAWAESDSPPDPTDVNSKSAKTWAMIASDVIPIATSTLLGKVKLGETIEGQTDGTINVASKVFESIDNATHLQQIAKRSTLGGWTILCEPNKPVYVKVTGEGQYAYIWFLIKKNGDMSEKVPILLGQDQITSLQTSNTITIIPQEEIIILEIFRSSEGVGNTTIYAYQ